MSRKKNETYVLGLDLGTESIGWALVKNKKGKPESILKSGAHTFDAGVEGNIESGGDESRAKARRDARLPRRQHWRRAWRRRKILRILQRNGMMPEFDTSSPTNVHEGLLAVDSKLREKHSINSHRVSAHLLPYILRKKALEEKLPLHDVGRALYHLAQRRGFLSNRKAGKADDDEGVVKEGISELRQKMEASHSPTLGAYFATLDPEEERIRKRWTSRQMYQDEFYAIWAKQQKHHKALTDELKKELYNALFFQRPLKSQKHLVGKCELIPGAKHAPIALRITQRFRLLQAVNNLWVYLPDNTERTLTRDERNTLIEALETQGDLSFAAIRKMLKLKKGTTFNLEEGGEKRIPGNRTNTALFKIFGDRWLKLTENEKDAVVQDLMSFEKAEPLARRSRNTWKLDKQAALELSELSLEEGYARHSRRALEILTPRLEEGLPYATAKKDEFPESFESTDPLDTLPPVIETVPDLRNPAVCRALTELRKVINAIIRRYGKPEIIRIELARNLKQAKKKRAEISKKNRQNEKSREKAKAKILKELKDSLPSRTDIQKVLLAEECNWICPYTGRSIDMKSLLGKNPQFDIEHILPMSKSLDNSYANRTLCYHEENRDRKGNRTPYEAYHANPENWEQILGRVKKFSGDMAREKLRRFQMEEMPEGFAARALNDTRYISRLAGDYLALLYGGRSDADGKQRIQVSTGGITHHLRNEWAMNSILNDGGEKSRDDHRHHAVDAIAIALASPATVKQLSEAAVKAQQNGRRLFAPVPEPWKDFLAEARDSINRINVSKRASRKIAGILHAETLYSKPMPSRNGEGVRHIRKELHKLSVTEIKGNAIVDPTIRRLVQDKFTQLGENKPDKVFSDPDNHPIIVSSDGRTIPIHKVRIKAKVKPWKIGKGPKERYVSAKAGSNHHTIIVASLDKSNNEIKWEDHPASRFDVHIRKNNKEEIIKRTWNKGQRFRFSITPNDYIIMKDSNGEEQLYRVASISKGDIEFRLHNDARTMDKVKAAKQRVRAGAEKMRKHNARKVHVTYLGEVIPAND